MRKTIGLVLLFILPLVVGYMLVKKDTPEQPKLDQLKEKYAKEHTVPVDHSKFPQLQVAFARPQDVTKACITCHNKRHEEVMKTSHWRWLSEEYMEGKGIVSIGKRNILNNHCIAIGGSEGSCNRCHIGYGYDSKDFDFDNAENIDCLACHDNSGLYEKQIEGAGNPKPGLDFTTISQKVGLPKMDNCGYCHFNGGGGNNSKHGDLEEALYEANRDVDVHLAHDGGNMECTTCHTAENHKMKGRLYTVTSMDKNRLLCEDCHTSKPHDDDIINEHTIKVACQTCHIPEYAKVNATKTHWDWSKAGKLRNGEPYHVYDKDGNETYLSIKGEIIWEKHLKPEYAWFNGTARHHLLEDTIREIPLVLNPLGGSFEDMNAKIMPVKVMRTIQPYDPIYNKLVSPKLWDKDYGKGAYWKDFNWDTAIAKGMEYVNMPWSGKYGFVETEMNWLLNHMVSPKEKSVKCEECHTRIDSRLEAITDVYLPGRDYNPLVDNAGVALIVMSFFGVAAHGTVRVIYSRRNRKEKKNG